MLRVNPFVLHPKAFPEQEQGASCLNLKQSGLRVWTHDSFPALPMCTGILQPVFRRGSKARSPALSAGAAPSTPSALLPLTGQPASPSLSTHLFPNNKLIPASPPPQYNKPAAQAASRPFPGTRCSLMQYKVATTMALNARKPPQI